MSRLAKTRLLVVSAAMLSGALRACEPCVVDDGVREGADIGVRNLTAWDALPVVKAARYDEYSSYDREPNQFQCITDPGNKDFNNFMGVRGLPGPVAFAHIDDTQPSVAALDSQGYVIAASDDGPGYISRIWLGQFGLSALLTEELFNENETISVYVDDFCQPVYRGRVKDWEAGSSPPFSEPLAGCRSGGYVSYVPISFNSRVRVLLDNLSPTALYYFQVDVQRVYEETAPFSPLNFTDQGCPGIEEDLNRLFGRAGENPNEGFREVVLPPLTLSPGDVMDVAGIEGCGAIKLLQFVLPDATLDQLRKTDLRITWDDGASAAVDLPLSAFFGLQLAANSHKSLPMRVQRIAQGLELACYFPMPFERGALVQLLNNGAHPVEVLPTLGLAEDLPAGDWGHFHAGFNAMAAPVPFGSTYPVASIQGRGKYVGTFLFLEGRADVPHLGNLLPEHPLNFLEGDAIGSVDGVWRIRGTGTEDYLNGALYFRTGGYDYALSGVNHRATAGERGSISGYRWHILSDDINFYGSFELALEYGQGRPNTVERYQSVAYYYLTPLEPRL